MIFKTSKREIFERSKRVYRSVLAPKCGVVFSSFLIYTLRNTIEEKYNLYQKNRGYSGTVKSRNLHMLRETNAVAVFIELGNIRNSSDQKRFIIEDNRQAVANWLVDGLMNEK